MTHTQQTQIVNDLWGHRVNVSLNTITMTSHDVDSDTFRFDGRNECGKTGECVVVSYLCNITETMHSTDPTKLNKQISSMFQFTLLNDDFRL
jgi:hypothetical protein